ncbi:AraC family transcriptional regulator [Fimbriimonas ginsengisoli]|uniref:Transcriptional regulator, AraC family protein n=1 Tax=Fimbriimonas ginsengisoli Gsoil 348 TaxID=661478 RepID=A0A068NNK2_FIMGI|nr:AraC family transcriptional regulator [Fimbriimonas ginsengisoli]AIE85031.1 transcriptional regulator, AraC family protein [Fimbriimonas ginsengisoli Gsoil 348]
MARDWIARLNTELGRLAIGGGRLDLLHWAYDEHLRDNQPHRHTHFEACLVGAHGSGTFTALGTDHRLTPGTFFLARPGVVHQIRNDGPELMELVWVSFAWSDDGGTPRTPGERLMRNFAASDAIVAMDDGRIRSLWDALRAVAPTALPEQVRALVQTLVLEMAQALAPDSVPAERPDPHARIAQQAVRYIEDNLYRPLAVDEIANYVHVSPRHLGRLFAAFTGTSPTRYMMLARLDRASALLQRGDLPIKEIADSLGFSDSAYFTRCFTRRYGVAPAAFRRGEGEVRIVQSPGGLV